MKKGDRIICTNLRFEDYSEASGFVDDTPVYDKMAYQIGMIFTVKDANYLDNGEHSILTEEGICFKPSEVELIKEFFVDGQKVSEVAFDLLMEVDISCSSNPKSSEECTNATFMMKNFLSRSLNVAKLDHHKFQIQIG